MKKISCYIFLVIAISAVNADDDCGYNFVRSKYQGTYAETACNNSDECFGISFQQSNTFGFPYYYLTGKGKYKFSVGFTLIKNCNNFRQLQFNNYIEQAGKDLSGCLNECKSYKTLEEAQRACFDSYQCNGVTFSRDIKDGGDSIDGEWVFQLRTGKIPYPSINGETSWTKIQLEY